MEARKGSPNGDSHSEEWDHATWFFARGVGLLASAEILAGVSEAKETLDTVHELDVPFYLHPRSPLATRQQAYEGHEWIAGSPWGFAVETSIHALRLMGSGLFDEFPKLQIILGHLGEGLPFGKWRVDNRIIKRKLATKAKRSMSQYLRENFYITTSGNFRTQALTDVMLEVGSDRVLYSVDYPYEFMDEASNWFENVPIRETDRVKIARGNARMLFHL